MRWHRPLVGALALGSAAASSPSRGGGAASFSPIKELGPSLAASVAGGTIVATRSLPMRPSPPQNTDDAVVDGEEECVVVLFRSPAAGDSGSKKLSVDTGNLTISSVFGCSSEDSNKFTDTAADSNQQSNYHRGLSFLPNGPVTFPFLPGGSSHANLRVLHAPSGLLIAATGFAPDADHLLHVAAGRVLSRASVFDAPDPSSLTSSKSVDPHRLVREDLSSMMIDAAMAEGSRPLGVQLLVIGQSALASRRANKHCALEVYAVDPSGGWRSCVGAGTAVGRGAERVRTSLHRCNSATGDETSDRENAIATGWRGALQRAMMAAIDALEGGDDASDVDVPRNDATAKYGAIVIFGRPDGARRQLSTSRCAAIDPKIVEEARQTCWRTVEVRGRRKAG